MWRRPDSSISIYSSPFIYDWQRSPGQHISNISKDHTCPTELQTFQRESSRPLQNFWSNYNLKKNRTDIFLYHSSDHFLKFAFGKRKSLGCENVFCMLNFKGHQGLSKSIWEIERSKSPIMKLTCVINIFDQVYRYFFNYFD